MDQILFADLTQDYNQEVDLQCLIGSGAGANAKGILPSGARSAEFTEITYIDSTATVAELYPKLADAVQRISTNRGLPPDLIVMHPRRWGWFTSASDGQGRPLVDPAGPSQNAPGESNADQPRRNRRQLVRLAGPR